MFERLEGTLVALIQNSECSRRVALDAEPEGEAVIDLDASGR
jgi:hypothetical protein